MKIETKPFDAAEYITDLETAAAFLDQALEEDCDDPRYFKLILDALARSESMTEISRITGITRKGLYKALSEDGNPSLITIMKIMRALGLRLSATPLLTEQSAPAYSRDRELVSA